MASSYSTHTLYEHSQIHSWIVPLLAAKTMTVWLCFMYNSHDVDLHISYVYPRLWQYFLRTA